MVTPRRQAVRTVAFIDNYCQNYYSLFEDVRHFEAFKFLHLGMLSKILAKCEIVNSNNITKIVDAIAV